MGVTLPQFEFEFELKLRTWYSVLILHARVNTVRFIFELVRVFFSQIIFELVAGISCKYHHHLFQIQPNWILQGWVRFLMVSNLHDATLQLEKKMSQQYE